MLRVLVVLAMLFLVAPAVAQTGWPKSGPVATDATAPAAQQQPVIVMPNEQGVLGWVQAIITALVGGGGVAGLFTLAMRFKSGGIDKAEAKDLAEAAALRLIKTGLPGQALQYGASLIPGAGPLLARLEPTLRQKVIAALENDAGPTQPGPDGVGGVSPDLAAKILGRLDELLNKPHFPPQA